MDGSMVLAILSVFHFLRSQSAKNETQKKMKYRCESSHLGYRVSPVIDRGCRLKPHGRSMHSSSALTFIAYRDQSGEKVALPVEAKKARACRFIEEA
jgi:hypothetical protein